MENYEKYINLIKDKYKLLNQTLDAQVIQTPFYHIDGGQPLTILIKKVGKNLVLFDGGVTLINLENDKSLNSIVIQKISTICEKYGCKLEDGIILIETNEEDLDLSLNCYIQALVAIDYTFVIE